MVANRKVPGHPVQRVQGHSWVVTHDELPVVRAGATAIIIGKVVHKTGVVHGYLLEHMLGFMSRIDRHLFPLWSAPAGTA